MLIMSVSDPILRGTGIFWRFYSTYRTPALQANPLTPLAPYWTSFDATNKMARDHARPCFQTMLTVETSRNRKVTNNLSDRQTGLCLAIADSGMRIPPDDCESMKSATDTDSMERELQHAKFQTYSATAHSLKNGDMIRVCKKTKRNGATEMLTDMRAKMKQQPHILGLEFKLHLASKAEIIEAAPETGLTGCWA